VLPVIELKSSWHGERSILPRWIETWVYPKLNFLCFRVAAAPEESFELDFASSWSVAVFALQRPYQR
jgi:hypothetical protein